MRIEIDTEGIGTGTKISINGKPQGDLKFFEVSVNVDRSNKVKLIMTKVIDGKPIPMEFFGEGIRKFDEAEQMEGSNNGKCIGSERTK